VITNTDSYLAAVYYKIALGIVLEVHQFIVE